MRRIPLVVLAGLLLAAVGATGQPDAAPDEAPPSLPHPFLSLEPAPRSVIANATPEIVVRLDSGTPIVESTLALRLGVFDLAGLEGFAFDGETIRFPLPGLLALPDGTHNATVAFTGADGTPHAHTWAFTVDITPRAAHAGGPSTRTIVLAALGGVALLAAAGAGTLLYLQRTRNLTPRKILARHPVKREVFVLWVPLALATTATLLALVAVTSRPDAPRFAVELTLLTGILLGLAPYALDAQRGKRRRRAAERAWGQFLFELADAMRGGIDPVKAIQELARTETGILARPLRAAADGLRMGRPLDVVLPAAARSLGSPLIARYASLVAEASRIGGETAGVVHRAAKDMEDLVRIDRERDRQLQGPVATMYIAFGVLLLMVKSLLDFAPGLLETDLAGSGLFGGAAAVPRMELPTLQARLFHLVLIASAGTGLLIGSFTEGRVRNGLVHGFVMLGGATGFFLWMVGWTV